MSRWWVTFTKRLGYASQDMLLVGRSHSMMCAPPGQMCPYCFQSEFQAFGAETKLNFLTCVPVEANKESSLHFLKCSVLFTSPKTQQEKFICWLGELEGGFPASSKTEFLYCGHFFWCLSGNCWEQSCFRYLCAVVTLRSKSGKEICIFAVTNWIKWNQVLWDLCCAPSNMGRVVSYFLAVLQVLPLPNNKYPKCLMQVLLHSQMGSVRPKVRHQQNVKSYINVLFFSENVSISSFLTALVLFCCWA